MGRARHEPSPAPDPIPSGRLTQDRPAVVVPGVAQVLQKVLHALFGAAEPDLMGVLNNFHAGFPDPITIT